jgi:WD40 repeat protein
MPANGQLAIKIGPKTIRIIVQGGLRSLTSQDNTVRVWGSHVLEGHNGWVNTVALSPDGKRVVSGADDRTVRLGRCIRIFSTATMIKRTGLYGHR